MEKLYQLGIGNVTEYKGLSDIPTDAQGVQGFISKNILSIYQTSDQQILVSSLSGLKNLKEWQTDPIAKYQRFNIWDGGDNV